MKRIFLLFFSIPLVLTCASQVGIGTTTPDTSAELEIKSTSKGFLPPRLTIAQRDSIKTPTGGLEIWCTDCRELEVFDGIIWKNMLGNAACALPIPSNVTICNQVWMTQNLDVVTYRNGDTIPQVTDSIEWTGLTTGAWCWQNNDSARYASTYGRLYNWFAVNDPRGLAPLGWHVPSDSEWTTLSTCLGGEWIAGGKMKKTGIALWHDPNIGASNISGFTALPGGVRSAWFGGIGFYGMFWSSQYDGWSAWVRIMYSTQNRLYKDYFNKAYGISVRCIKD